MSQFLDEYLSHTHVDLNLLVGVMTFTFSPLHCFYTTIVEGGAADRRRRPILVYIYIYIYMCVCVPTCVWHENSHSLPLVLCCEIRSCHPRTCDAALATNTLPIRSAPSFPRSMSLWAPSPARREANCDLWRSFRHCTVAVSEVRTWISTDLPANTWYNILLDVELNPKRPEYNTYLVRSYPANKRSSCE